MNQVRHSILSASHIIFQREDQVLLIRRFQTGYGDGQYSLPAGHVEPGEFPAATAIREAAEEVGIRIEPGDLSFGHIMFRRSERDRADFFFVCRSFAGEPQNLEPEKCDELRWAAIDDLPENTLPYIRLALENISNQIPFSEFTELN